MVKLRVSADGAVVWKSKSKGEDVDVVCKLVDGLYYLRCNGKHVTFASIQQEGVQSVPVTAQVTYQEGGLVVRFTDKYGKSCSCAFSVALLLDVASDDVKLKAFSDVFDALRV